MENTLIGVERRVATLLLQASYHLLRTINTAVEHTFVIDWRLC
jgi:hypothetical protein